LRQYNEFEKAPVFEKMYEKESEAVGGEFVWGGRGEFKG